MSDLRPGRGVLQPRHPRLDPLGHGLLDDLLLLGLDLLGVAKDEAVVQFLLLLFRKRLLIEDIWVSIGQLLAVNNIFRKLCKPAISHPLLCFCPGSR